MSGIMQMFVGGSYASPPSVNYIGQLYNGLGTNQAYGRAVDANGDSYICGTSFDGTYGYGTLAKYDSSGVYQWQITPTNRNSFWNKSLVDSSGNVYVVGTFRLGSYNQIALAKYNSSGTLQWAKYLALSIDAYGGHNITIDSSGNIYIVGGTNSNLSSSKIIIAKFNSSGTLQWQRTLSGSYGDVGYGVCVDSSGNVYGIGFTISSSNYAQFIIFKYNSLGTIQWQNLLGAGTIGNSASGRAISIDSSSNIYIAGNATISGTGSILIAKYNTSGAIQWQRALGTSGGNSVAESVATDSTGNIYIAGTGGSSSNGVIAKYDSSGTIQWQRKIGPTSGASCTDIKVSTDGTLYVAGTYYSEWLFESLPNNGDKTGTYTVNGNSIVYAAASMTGSTPTLPDSTASLTDAAGTYTNTTLSLSNLSYDVLNSAVTII